MPEIGEIRKGYRNGYQKGLTDGTDKQIQELQRTIKKLQQELGYVS